MARVRRRATPALTPMAMPDRAATAAARDERAQRREQIRLREEEEAAAADAESQETDEEDAPVVARRRSARIRMSNGGGGEEPVGDAHNASTSRQARRGNQQSTPQSTSSTSHRRGRTLPVPPSSGGGGGRPLPVPPNSGGGGGRPLPVPPNSGGGGGRPLPVPPNSRGGGGRPLPVPPNSGGGGGRPLPVPPNPGGGGGRPTVIPLPAPSTPDSPAPTTPPARMQLNTGTTHWLRIAQGTHSSPRLQRRESAGEGEAAPSQATLSPSTPYNNRPRAIARRRLAPGTLPAHTLGGEEAIRTNEAARADRPIAVARRRLNATITSPSDSSDNSETESATPQNRIRVNQPPTAAGNNPNPAPAPALASQLRNTVRMSTGGRPYIRAFPAIGAFRQLRQPQRSPGPAPRPVTLQRPPSRTSTAQQRTEQEKFEAELNQGFAACWDMDFAEILQGNDAPVSCMVCMEEEFDQQGRCVFCKKTIGCIECIEDWIRKNTKDPADTPMPTLPTCPNCRHQWKGEKLDGPEAPADRRRRFLIC